MAEYRQVYPVWDLSQDKFLQPRKPHSLIAAMKAKMESKDFGWALAQLRQGERVARAGWNGKGMWLVHQKAYPNGIPINENTSQATGIPQGTVCEFLPYIMMKVATKPEEKPCFVPWLASQTDLLTCDWDYAEGYVKS